jgi:hypothetical protein
MIQIVPNKIKKVHTEAPADFQEEEGMALGGL